MHNFDFEKHFVDKVKKETKFETESKTKGCKLTKYFAYRTKMRINKIFCLQGKKKKENTKHYAYKGKKMKKSNIFFLHSNKNI